MLEEDGGIVSVGDRAVGGAWLLSLLSAVSSDVVAAESTALLRIIGKSHDVKAFTLHDVVSINADRTAIVHREAIIVDATKNGRMERRAAERGAERGHHLEEASLC